MLPCKDLHTLPIDLYWQQGKTGLHSAPLAASVYTVNVPFANSMPMIKQQCGRLDVTACPCPVMPCLSEIPITHSLSTPLQCRTTARVSCDARRKLIMRIQSIRCPPSWRCTSVAEALHNCHTLGGRVLSYVSMKF